MGLISAYATFLRREPRARAYLGASLVDDVGIAASAWASTLLMTNLAVTQRARASFMVPALVCFLAGALVSGPLADRAGRASAAALPAWRWRIVLGGRVLETIVLGLLVGVLALGPPTVGRVLPYVMVSAFMKTALRATRVAFAVDLLSDELPARSPAGDLLRDERGAPLAYKAHLVTSSSLLSLLSTVALLIGLLIGGRVLALVGGRSHLLFAFDVVTNLGFCGVVWTFCRPAATGVPIPAATPGARLPAFWSSLVEGFRFLAQPAQRPLLALLAGSWLVEVITEAYDGKMIVKHILHAGDGGVRHAELVWSLTAAGGAALLPVLIRRVSHLGKIFLVTMVIDGLVIALAGRIAGAGTAAAMVPFTIVVAADRSLTSAATTLVDVAQNSVSSAAMRGRIAGSYALCTIAGDLLSEALATAAESRWGIPGLIVRAGLLQVGLVVLIAVAVGGRLWSFGLRTQTSS